MSSIYEIRVILQQPAIRQYWASAQVEATKLFSIPCGPQMPRKIGSLILELRRQSTIKNNSVRAFCAIKKFFYKPGHVQFQQVQGTIFRVASGPTRSRIQKMLQFLRRIHERSKHSFLIASRQSFRMMSGKSKPQIQGVSLFDPLLK
jgi:hypothetical protein